MRQDRFIIGPLRCAEHKLDDLAYSEGTEQFMFSTEIPIAKDHLEEE